jgi:hypothetical protein
VNDPTRAPGIDASTPAPGIDASTPAPGIDAQPPRPHNLSAWTDPTTERMRQETGHDCITCPGDVRNLMATAHNLLVKLDAHDWSGVARKQQAVREALEKLQPVADQHFEALNGWRRP